MWFFRDDWLFITDRELTDPGSLFEPHNGHWSTVPIVVFRVLYRIFGIDSYRPYQAAVVVMHLGVCVLVRIIARRVGVGPWLATVLAGLLVLFGAGREDIIWGFQVGFTGAMFFALLLLVLAAPRRPDRPARRPRHRGRRPGRDERQPGHPAHPRGRCSPARAPGLARRSPFRRCPSGSGT